MSLREFKRFARRRLWVFTAEEEELLALTGAALAAAGYPRVLVGRENWYVYAPGEVPVLLVAHADTAHDGPPAPELVFADWAKGVLWSPDGLGADDRAGVLGILWLVAHGHRPHVVVTRGEESGGVGARRFAAEVSDPGVKFVVELDRRGASDAVFYECDNPEFERFICSFGFRPASGSFSDISFICPVWGVAGVNLSCGYYNAHTSSEFLVLPALYETLQKVVRILEAARDCQRFAYTTRKKATPRAGRTAWWRADDLGFYEHYTATSASVVSTAEGWEVPVVVTLDLEDLAARLGGTEEYWHDVVDLYYSTLVAAAEDAIYDVLYQFSLPADQEAAEERRKP